MNGPVVWIASGRAASARGCRPAGSGRPWPLSRPSIAIIPLENLSADAEQEYFSDGMTDALFTDLAKLHGFR